MQQRQTFNRNERLRSRKQIDALFGSPRSFAAFPIRLLVSKPIHQQEFPVQSLFVVPKRSFKRAHDRNRLKRRMREAFRLNKAGFYEKLVNAETQLVMAFIFTGKKDETYAVIEKAMRKLLEKASPETTSGSPP